MIKNLSINTINNIGLDVAAEYHDGVKNGQLVVLCPGYLDSKDYPHLVSLSQVLAEQGYTVARFDPTGTWKSGGTIADYSISRYLNDIKHVIDYLLAQEKFAKIILIGHSLGGMVSLVYAARDKRISKVIAIMAPYSFIRPGKIIEKGDRVSKRDIPGDKFNKKEFRVPFSMVKDSEQYNAIDAVSNINIPLVFIIGEKDSVVLPEDTKCIFDAANEPKKFIQIKKIGHDYRRNQVDIEKINREIITSIIEA